MHLQHTLTELEDQLAAARRAYSGSVTAYNNALEMFPSSLMAGMMNLQPETVYKAEAVASQRPDLDMLFNAKTSQA
jgi:LemA protein